MIKITNAGNNDNNNSPNTGSSIRKKRMDNSKISQFKKQQRKHLEMIPDNEYKNDKKIRKVTFEIEQEIKFYDDEMVTREKQYQQQQQQDKQSEGR